MTVKEAIKYMLSTPLMNWQKRHDHLTTSERAMRVLVSCAEKQIELEELLKLFWQYHLPSDRLRADDVYMILESVLYKDKEE